jgi:hypothetical protein
LRPPKLKPAKVPAKPIKAIATCDGFRKGSTHPTGWRGATSHRDVPNDPGINERPAARTVSVEAPMLQPLLGLDPDRFSLLKRPLR